MFINAPLPPALLPIANIKNLATGQIVVPNVPLIETAPGNYTANIDIPTKPVPKPKTKEDDDILPPLPQPIPVEVIISNIGSTDGIDNVAVGSNIMNNSYVVPTVIPQIPILVDNSNRCPYCFSKIGEGVDITDFKWSDDPTLMMGSKIMKHYQGHMRISAKHIKELQDNRKALESSVGITPLTEFSPIDTTYFFRDICKYILELRDSTEKILIAVERDKETYFNYNELGTEMRTNHQMDWIDVVDLTSEALVQFQVKGLHIEDLRHYIETIIFKETWDTIRTPDEYNYIWNDEQTLTYPPGGSYYNPTPISTEYLRADYIWKAQHNGLFSISCFSDISHTPASTHAKIDINFSKSGIPGNRIISYNALALQELTNVKSTSSIVYSQFTPYLFPGFTKNLPNTIKLIADCSGALTAVRNFISEYSINSTYRIRAKVGIALELIDLDSSWSYSTEYTLLEESYIKQWVGIPEIETHINNIISSKFTSDSISILYPGEPHLVNITLLLYCDCNVSHLGDVYTTGIFSAQATGIAINNIKIIRG